LGGKNKKEKHFKDLFFFHCAGSTVNCLDGTHLKKKKQKEMDRCLYEINRLTVW
jgi:hypothetical protein